MTRPWTESDYQAAGYVRLSLRMRAEDRAAIDSLSELTGESKAELLARLAKTELKKAGKKKRK